VLIVKRAVRAIQSSNQIPMGESGDSLNPAELFADQDGAHPGETILREDETETIRKLLEAIDQREAIVLRLRFGLDGRPPLTLKEIGEEIGLTRERVRQIEYNALDRLNAQLRDDRPSRFFKENLCSDGQPRPAHRRKRSRRRASSMYRNLAGKKDGLVSHEGTADGSSLPPAPKTKENTESVVNEEEIGQKKSDKANPTYRQRQTG